ncbi:dTDP-4-amino-4,6-dideoxygalactose transaminase [Endozoicomonadaceae bacterium StTr2]
MNNKKIKFNQPYLTGKELLNLQQAIAEQRLSGDGGFTKKCHQWLEKETGSYRALLTHSCTAALEMSALLLDIQPGDEVIMPSYTFVSTANAFVLRGAVPVFVDIRKDTLNINEKCIAGAITPRTKAIVVVHYAGVSCDMDSILEIAHDARLMVVEDAAQGLMAKYKGMPLGSIGDLGAFSFHETKNIISGEGGALLVQNQALATQAEMIREKGTDRSRFLRGEVDKYTWQVTGSSYLPNELTAAVLWAQLESAHSITEARVKRWDYYHALTKPLEDAGLVQRASIPRECEHNGHIYYLVLSPEIDRQAVISRLKKNNIESTFHYVPLHSSPAGQHYGRVSGPLDVTNHTARHLIRLPLWPALTEDQQDYIVRNLQAAITSNR